MQIGGARVTAFYLNHPAVTPGYRIEAGGVTLVYATDHEPHSRHQPDLTHWAAEGAAGFGSVHTPPPIHLEDQRHLEFLANADLVIHDAQYTAEEYPAKRGWGHSPVEMVVDFAVAASVHRLALFHHDPARSDFALERLERQCRERAAQTSHSQNRTEVFAAAEGQEIELVERAGVPMAASTAPSAVVTEGASESGEPLAVLIVDDEPDVVMLLKSSLRPEWLLLLSASDAKEALRIARATRPALLLLDRHLGGDDGLDVLRACRADETLRGMPVVLLTGLTGEQDTRAGFDAGADDYLTKPFTPAYVRSRVRSWLARGASRRA